MFQVFLLSVLAFSFSVSATEIGAMFVNYKEYPAEAVGSVSDLLQIWATQHDAEKGKKKVPAKFAFTQNLSYIKTVVGASRVTALEKAIKDQKGVASKLLDVIRSYSAVAYSSLKGFVAVNLDPIDPRKKTPIIAMVSEHLGKSWMTQDDVKDWGKLMKKAFSLKDKKDAVLLAANEIAVEFDNWTQSGDWTSGRYYKTKMGVTKGSTAGKRYA